MAQTTTWIPVAATAVGAIIALAGTVSAGMRTDRDQRRRDREADRLRTYIDFALALDRAHAGLREVARSAGHEPDRSAAAVRAVHESDLYGVRERLLMSGSAELVVAGEAAFARIIDIRDAVRAGAALSSQEYHGGYHEFADAIWRFRIAARGELGQRAFAPAALGRTSWSEREQCPRCGSSAGLE